MNIQIYINRKNPDVLKAERFFKERRIPFQEIDLKKHKLSPRELDVFVRVIGAPELVDRSSQKSLEKPVAHMTGDLLIVQALLDDPSALRSPLVRNGNKVTVGADETTWKMWLEE